MGVGEMEECVGAMPPAHRYLRHVCRIFIMRSYRKYGESDIVIYSIILQQLIAVTDVIKSVNPCSETYTVP